MTARDVIVKAVCHDEQLEIWADEFLEHFLAGDFLRPPNHYEDKISLVRTIKDAIKDLIEKALEHPELQTEHIRLELAHKLCPEAFEQLREMCDSSEEGSHYKGEYLAKKHRDAELIAAARRFLPSPPETGELGEPVESDAGLPTAEDVRGILRPHLSTE